MKKSFTWICMLLFTSASIIGQPLIIKGRIKCLNPTVASTKGAENILVVPTFLPSKSTVTASRPSGYFEFNTGVPLAKLQDKLVSIYVISRCASCRDGVKRVFISEDQDRQNRSDNKIYYTIKDWTLNTVCTQAELNALRTDSLLNVITRQPGQDLDKVSASTALVGTPAFLNFLTNVITAVGVLPNAGAFEVQNIYPGKTNFGQFLMSSPLSQSANTGFNFSPGRDMSEAVFWNPSAIAFSRKLNNISLLTNVKNNIKLSGYARLNEKLSVGVGGIYTMQDELRRVGFYRIGGNRQTSKDSIVTDSFPLKLKEYGGFISGAYMINNQLSIGLTVKSTWQKFNNPDRLDISNARKATFTDTTISNQYFDADLSLTYKVNPSLQLGINLMNLAGTELYADVFVPWKEVPVRNQRSLGAGLCYKYERWNFGADVLITQDDFYDASIGINYVPFNNALLSAGYAFKQSSYSFAFRMKHFRLAYINDNDGLYSQERQGKSPILNGRIYGGFIFDFD